jgi:decaprenylphospho-beta-D-ribofuranose 2-oxidase
MNSARLLLSGWGNYPKSYCTVQRPEKIDSVISAIESQETVLARGLGKSYGDASFNPSGLTILMTRLNRILEFDELTGRIVCESGVTLKEIIDLFLLRGWFLAVTPGLKEITVGGAVASDVHGKNHHVDGSFGNFVNWIKVLVASGEILQCSRSENPDLFWATLGGMGLTGIIIDVEFQLKPITTAYIQNLNIKAKNIDEVFDLFSELEPKYQYSVAWIDCLAQGSSIGRSILMFGNHAKPSDLKDTHRKLTVPIKKIGTIPFDLPSGILNPWSIKLFNSAYYHLKSLKSGQNQIIDYNSFFYPLDIVSNWNRLYGSRGFIQHQCVFPLETSKPALKAILRLYAARNCGSFLAVLKRFGSQEGLLSFPMKGYTLALDIPVQPHILKLIDEIDKLVVHFGGRIYLTKDSCCNASTFQAMYPSFLEWFKIKQKFDPENHFSSALSQRLNIRY